MVCPWPAPRAETKCKVRLTLGMSDRECGPGPGAHRSKSLRPERTRIGRTPPLAHSLPRGIARILAVATPRIPLMTDYLAQLNEEQRQAVEPLDGPLLVLAGAGTGKTRVLTTRFAHILLSKKAFPNQVLAVTFTNKAAREMRERVAAILGQPAEGLWLGPFP